MNRIALSFLTLITAALFTSCTSNERFEVGGVPEWIMGGAKLSSEPAPRQPDNAIIAHDRASGPVRFSYVTDKYRYPAPPKKKVAKEDTRDPLERGRDRRIKRLVR